MFTRRKTLLRLIELAGGTASRLRLVKWAFLFAEEADLEPPHRYQFVPYRFGPFSFTMYHDLDVLIRKGKLARTSEEGIGLGPSLQGQDTALRAPVERQVERCWRKYGRLATGALLDTVYGRYPWFTINSDREELRAFARPSAPPGVYTVGYEGMQVDGLMNRLLQSGITGLADVRRNPVSRRYGFHKSTLRGICGRLNLSYLHVPELGVPPSWRANVKGKADYRRLFRRYENEVLETSKRLLGELASVVARRAVALMCQEADPDRCHRTVLGELVAGMTGLVCKDLTAA